jgi:hypothetical protein
MMTIEHTDTFGGEANYSFVNRYYCKDTEKMTARQAITLAKKVTGLTGVRCREENFGGCIAISPIGIFQVVYIDYSEDSPENCEYWRKEVDRNGNEVTQTEEE